MRVREQKERADRAAEEERVLTRPILPAKPSSPGKGAIVYSSIKPVQKLLENPNFRAKLALVRNGQTTLQAIIEQLEGMECELETREAEKLKRRVAQIREFKHDLQAIINNPDIDLEA